LNHYDTFTRRDIIAGAALTAALAAAGPARAHGAPAGSVKTIDPAVDRWRGLKASVASYTLRTMPLDRAIQAIRRVGLHYVSIKDSHCPLDSSAEARKEVVEKFKAAGITPLSCGVVSMRNDEGEIRKAFEYARDLGLPTIVASPDPGALPILDRMTAEFNIRIAIHNHGPEDRKFPSPNEVWKAVQGHDPRVGLCIDVGHTARAGVDPSACMRRYRDRLFDCHFKDISAISQRGNTVEGGRGVLDMRAMLQALLDIRYAGLLSFEYEKDAMDPIPGLAETIGYSKGLLAGR
jgi:sugar phosphate isomerase/epimerase